MRILKLECPVGNSCFSSGLIWKKRRPKYSPCVLNKKDTKSIFSQQIRGGFLVFPKTSIAPENRWLEDEIVFWNGIFSGAILVSRGVYMFQLSSAGACCWVGTNPGITTSTTAVEECWSFTWQCPGGWVWNRQVLVLEMILPIFSSFVVFWQCV